MNKERVLENLLSLCNIPSVSGSDGERTMAATIQSLLMKHSYFQKHPTLIDIFEIPEDEMHGNFIFARYECATKTDKTVLLLSHFDVVGIDEYGAGKAYAFDPVRYTSFLKEGHIILDEESQADLDSGHYLFGRGVCDMKWGLAADMEALFHCAEHPDDIQANVLLVSVPDEERNSQGMLAAVKQLLQYQELHHLHIEHCIVSEPDISPDKRIDGKRMFVGAAGKIMPMFYCVGKETHVGDPYVGLNPNLLSAALVSKMELNPDYIDTAHGYETPAPTCLKQSDGKDHYSVQTPYDAYCYFNLMTLSKSPNILMEELCELAYLVFDEVLQKRETAHQIALKKTNKNIPCATFKSKVMTYQTLYQRCVKLHGQPFVEHMNAFINNLSNDDLRMMSLAIIKEVHTFLDDRDPMIIVSFVPPYYPHSGFLADDSVMLKACAYIAKRAQAHHEDFEINHCFNGLTDMAYLSLREPVDIDHLTCNFPLWGKHYEVPLQAIRDLNIDFVNFGPLGKDAHKYSERIDLDYSMNTALPLLWELIQQLGR